MAQQFTPSLRASESYYMYRAKDAARHVAYADLVTRSARRTKRFTKSLKKAAFLTQLIQGFGSPDHIPASSTLCRQVAAEHFISALHRTYFDRLIHRSQTLYLLTLVHPDHRTGDKKCEIDLDHMRKQLWNLMRSISPNYIGVIEFDVTVNAKSVSDPEDGGRDVAPHMHVVFWTDKEIQPKVLSETMSKRIGEHADGIKAVNIRRCKGTEEDILRMAGYLFKSPSGGKTKVFRKSHDDNGLLVKTEERRKPVGKGARPIIASRQAELLSHFDLRKLLISGGEGNELKEYITRSLLAETKMFQRFAPEGFGLEMIRSFWRMMRKQGWGKAYPEPKIKTRTPSKPATK